jgi:hypothetical protein
VPGRTGVNLEPETVARLAARGKKHPGHQGGQRQAHPVCRAGPHPSPRFKIFSGDDNLTLAAIGVGAHGLISVASNEAPAEVAQMVRAALNNNWAEARELERRFCPALRSQFLGVESRTGQDECSADGQVRLRSLAAGCRWCRPRLPPGPGWSAWPAKWACSSTRPSRRVSGLKSAFERSGMGLLPRRRDKVCRTRGEAGNPAHSAFALHKLRRLAESEVSEYVPQFP